MLVFLQETHVPFLKWILTYINVINVININHHKDTLRTMIIVKLPLRNLAMSPSRLLLFRWWKSHENSADIPKLDGWTSNCLLTQAWSKPWTTGHLLYQKWYNLCYPKMIHNHSIWLILNRETTLVTSLWWFHDWVMSQSLHLAGD